MTHSTSETIQVLGKFFVRRFYSRHISSWLNYSGKFIVRRFYSSRNNRTPHPSLVGVLGFSGLPIITAIPNLNFLPEIQTNFSSLSSISDMQQFSFSLQNSSAIEWFQSNSLVLLSKSILNQFCYSEYWIVQDWICRLVDELTFLQILIIQIQI